MASVTLAKDLKITQKSAWFMLHRLRHAARTPSFNAPLKGDVEAGITFAGGKDKNKHAKERKDGKQGALAKRLCSALSSATASYAPTTSPITKRKRFRGKPARTSPKQESIKRTKIKKNRWSLSSSGRKLGQ